MNRNAVEIHRQAAVNIILIAVFIIAAFLIVAPLIAEIQYNIAQRSGARANYDMTIKLDPFNSEHLAGYAKFLYKQSALYEDKLPYLEKAKSLYAQAIKLNPQNAEYFLGLGLAKLYIYKEYSEKKEQVGLGDFKTSVLNDPHGFNISYSAGYAGMVMWDYLKQADKESVLERLKYSLKLRPDYGKYIYPLTLEKTRDFGYLMRITPRKLAAQNNLYWFLVKNNLWQYRKEQAEIMNACREKEDKEKYEAEKIERAKRIEKVKEIDGNKLKFIERGDWQGKATYGTGVYKNGDMFWTGTIDGVLDVPKGEAVIAIQAKGSPADDIYPYMIISLDGEDIGETFIKSKDWLEYAFKINTDGGIKVLSVTFVNDGSLKTGEDRNLFIGEAKVESYGK